MLTPKDLDTLDQLAHQLATEAFAGEGSVTRNSNGDLRLTLTRQCRGGGGLYRARDVISSTFEDASLEITAVIDAATVP
jgi:hypothetical protein